MLLLCSEGWEQQCKGLVLLGSSEQNSSFPRAWLDLVGLMHMLRIAFQNEKNSQTLTLGQICKQSFFVFSIPLPWMDADKIRLYQIRNQPVACHSSHVLVAVPSPSSCLPTATMEDNSLGVTQRELTLCYCYSVSYSEVTQSKASKLLSPTNLVFLVSAPLLISLPFIL